MATQVGQGIGWGLCTLAGIVLGVYLFQRRSEETEPATDAPGVRAHGELALPFATHQHKPPVGQPVDLPHGRALERRELRGQEGTRLARALRPAGSGAG